MSYCRFTKEYPKCDLYCYEGEKGYITHTKDETFCDVDLKDFYNRVKDLKEEGYSVPDAVVAGIKEELDEEEAAYNDLPTGFRNPTNQ